MTMNLLKLRTDPLKGGGGLFI